MIKRFFFLFSALVFLFGNTSSGVASNSFLTHTQHTPIELKPISLDNSFQLAAVCFLGDKDCGDAKFENGDDYELDTKQQCKNEGYTIISCTSPEVPFGQCPYNDGYFKECKDINGEKCGSEGYAQTCPDGSILNESQVCPFDTSYKKCKCNPCEGYPYTKAEAEAEGYIVGASCQSCDTTMYQRQNAPCSGFLSCECGGEIGAASCKSGKVTKFNVCKSCCATSFIYNTTNCDQTKNIFCGDSCGGRYEKCRPRPFIGSTTTIDGITFATEEALCPGLKKFSGGGGFGYTDILTGKDYWVEACASTTQACLILSQDIETKSVVSLSDDVNCGNMTLSASCNTSTIKGNGHTLYMNDGIGVYFMQNCSSGTFRLENLTIDIEGKPFIYVAAGADSGCSDTFFDATVLSNVEVSDVIIRTSIAVNDLRKVKFYGNSFIEGKSKFATVHYAPYIYGTLNMKNIYVSSESNPVIYGTLNYRGEQLGNFILRGGTVNACVDKLAPKDCNSEMSGTVNYSGTIDLSRCNKSRITFNHVPNLCSSSIFSGAFWN